MARKEAKDSPISRIATALQARGISTATGARAFFRSNLPVFDRVELQSARGVTMREYIKQASAKISTSSLYETATGNAYSGGLRNPTAGAATPKTRGMARTDRVAALTAAAKRMAMDGGTSRAKLRTRLANIAIAGAGVGRFGRQGAGAAITPGASILSARSNAGGSGSNSDGGR